MTGDPRLLLLLLGGLWLPPARAGSHSFRAFTSSLSGPLPGVPQFSAVGYLDDVPITRYTSESHRAGPRAPWMEKITAEDPQYWERETERGRGAEEVLRANVRTAMNRVNQTGGLHMVQYMYGCELREDGSIGGVYQFAFDGQDFISFDKDRLTFTAAVDAAKITQDRWNSERSIAQREKDYLEGRCIEYLKKYLEYGAEMLRTVTPRTRISRRKTIDRTFLTGYAYGFYPREIEVKWVRNGVVIPWESSEILPNPDGTYQVRTTVEVQEGDDAKTYKYQVYHSSLPEIVTVVYEEKSLPKEVIIIIVEAIAGVALLPSLIIWAVYFRAKSGERNDPAPMTAGNTYSPVNRGDPPPTDSSSSQCSA